MFSSSALVFAELFNCVVGGTVLCIICYPLVGLIYDSGESPAIGSFLYGGLVLLNSKILICISQGLNEFNLKLFILFISLALFVEIIILLGIRYVKEQLYWFIVMGGCMAYIEFKSKEMIGDWVKKIMGSG